MELVVLGVVWKCVKSVDVWETSRILDQQMNEIPKIQKEEFGLRERDRNNTPYQKVAFQHIGHTSFYVCSSNWVLRHLCYGISKSLNGFECMG